MRERICPTSIQYLQTITARRFTPSYPSPCIPLWGALFTRVQQFHQYQRGRASAISGRNPSHTQPTVAVEKPTASVRGASKIPPELQWQGPQKPQEPQKTTQSFHKALKVAGLSARHIGGLTGGYIGKFVGKQIGGLITDLTGSKSLGKAAGTIAGTTSGALAGSLVGVAVPHFCPYGGALFTGVSGAFEAFKSNQEH
jgi:hypothetical protein